MDKKEIWKDLKGIWGKIYQVSNHGRIRSKSRKVLNSNRYSTYYINTPARIKKLRTNGIEKHLFTDLLCYDKDGKQIRKSAYVHKEVAIAFLTKPNPVERIKQIQKTKYFKKTNLVYRYVEHIDGDHENNFTENLRWINQYDLYLKQIELGRKEKIDLYLHSPLYIKKFNPYFLWKEK